MSREPHDIATNATAEQGEVMLDGPNGIALSLTPAAARLSAERIRAAADKALDQQRRAGRA